MRGFLLIALAVGALAFAEAVFYFVYYRTDRRQEELRRRLGMLRAGAAGPDILRPRRLSRRPWLSDFLAKFSVMARLERLLEQTDSTLSVAQLCTQMAGAAVAGVALGLVLRNLVFAVLLALLGGATPLVLILRARRRRSRQISEQLPDALDMMARSIAAGHALPSALQLAAEESPIPIAVELARTFEQQKLGLPLEQALVNMTQRVPRNLDLKLLTVSVVIQRDSGGNMVELLDNLAATVRDRFRFYSKLRVLTAESRISGLILGSLPFATALIIAATSPGYFAELGHGIGRNILMFGIASWCCGVLWIRALMKVHY